MFIFRKFKLLVFMGLISFVLGCGKTVLANDIILNDVNGKSVNISNSKGNPVILFFWTTWCPYCRKELKSLNLLYPQMKKEGITVYAVNIGESANRVKGFLKDFGLTFNVLLDQEALLADLYAVMGVPTYVLLNKAGEWVAHDNALPGNYENLLLK
jgi:peroxiredoxin